jgi:5-methyltetrahydrofolate--homocysteine methyltransferase
MSINDELYDAIVFGERDRVVELVQQALDNDEDVGELLNVTMIPALREVGDQFSRGEVFVPEMLVSARAMQAGVDIIEPLLVKSGHEPVARVAIGSVKGDLIAASRRLMRPLRTAHRSFVSVHCSAPPGTRCGPSSNTSKGTML